MQEKNRRFSPDNLALMVVCVLLNLGLGFIIALVKLPFYLDSLGTMLASFVLGPSIGCIVGVITVLVGSLYTPTLPAYVGTALAIAIYVGYVRRFGYLRKLVPTIIFGIGLGIISAVVSAPVTAFVYGGVSLTGSDFLTTFFRATGQGLLDSVVLGGLASDPFDKLLSSIIVLYLAKRVPNGFYEQDTHT